MGCPAPASGPPNGCYDYGEGNGQFDLNPNVASWLSHDAHSLYDAMTKAQRAGLSIWIDAGIRDFFNAQVSADTLAAALRNDGANLRIYDGFQALGPFASESAYQFDKVDWANAGQAVLVRYGNPDASQADIQLGDGRHVGTGTQILDRVYSAFYFVQSQWPDGDRTLGGEDDCRNLLDSLQFTTAEGRVSPYGVFLPPGYFDPQNASLRYPVVYFLHGYGMMPSDLVQLSNAFANYMISPAVPEANRLQKFIIVYVDGRCRPGGSLPVTTGDLCEEGTFYTDSVVPGSSAQMEKMFLELSTLIDSTYRTKPAADVQISPY
jgi:hypothetical protein